MKQIILSLIIILACAYSAYAQQTNEQKFEQDRKAILAMAGKHLVDFNFHEVYSLAENYTIKEKKYHETAHELVIVAEDTGKQIILQHMLQFKRGDKDQVIKHWSQVWTFEDTEILDYQEGTSWKKHTLDKADIAGTWSQLVTQTDDSPRYESYAKWKHYNGISEWVSQETTRPLPRREYSNRKDYDVLIARNAHIVTPAGWTHEQSNKKKIKRDKTERFLALERGFNTYTKVPEFDATTAINEWNETKAYWKLVRDFWSSNIKSKDTIAYTREVDGQSMRKTMRKLMDQAKKNKKLTSSQVDSALDKYLVKY